MKKLLFLAICLMAAGLFVQVMAQRTPVPATNGGTKPNTNTGTKPTNNTGTTTKKTGTLPTNRGVNNNIPSSTKATAIGIRLGAGTMGTEVAVSLQQQLSKKNYLEGIIGINKYDYRATGFYQYHYPLAVRGLTAFGGVGAHVGKTRSGGWNDIIDAINGNTSGLTNGAGVFAGVDAIGGIMYKVPQMPMNVSLDIKPAYSFNNHPKPFEIGAGLTVRWTFGSGGGGGNGSGNGNGSGSGTKGGTGTGGGSGTGSNTGTQSKDAKVKPYPGGNTNNGSNTNTNPTNNTNNGGGGRGNTNKPPTNTNTNNGGNTGGGSGSGSGGGNSNGETYDDGGGI